MYKITLEIANNGVVKTIVDDNANGGGEIEVEKTVHQLEGDETQDFEKTSDFLFDLCEDLGIDLGSKHTRRCLTFDTDYGDNYNHTESELNDLKRYHESEMAWIEKEIKVFTDAKTPTK